MGTLFPDSDEYPDHKPIASPVDDAKGAAPTVALIGLFLVSGEGPDNLVKVDMHPYGQQAIARQSTTSTDVPFFSNNSSEVAAQVVRQHRQRIDAAYLAINAMSSSTNAALLSM